MSARFEKSEKWGHRGLMGGGFELALVRSVELSNDLLTVEDSRLEKLIVEARMANGKSVALSRNDAVWLVDRLHAFIDEVDRVTAAFNGGDHA